ncbi:MAG TPA: ABC transporter permease [Verrucomicrobiae bacterium]|nr:ABC transporter permease [Verrucomicrobiae bacterium]
MKFAFLVAFREYAENAKTKGFWLGILLVPLIIFFSVQVPIWLEKKGTPTRHFVLVDQSKTLAPIIEAKLERSYQGQVFAALKEYGRKYADPGNAPGSLDEFISSGGQSNYLAQLQSRLKPGAPPFKPPRRAFQMAPLPDGLNADAEIATLAQELKPYLRGERQAEADGQKVGLAAAILIPRDIDQQIRRPKDKSATGQGIEYWAGNLADTKLREEVEETVNTEIRRREYLARGLDAAVIREVEQTYAPFASLNPKKESGKEAVSATDIIKQWAPSAFVYLLWVAIFAIVQMLLSNIIEEKSNRIIEVLLSSVTPGELMMGKLFGIAAVGLTMVGSWMLALVGILLWKTSGTGGAAMITNQMLSVLHSSSLIPMFGVYFVLGYMMYAACILALGSVCNTLKEAQSYMGVITMIMMVPLLTLTFIPKDPNGVLARVLSWIPLYTPFIMMNRTMADPPLIDLIGTTLLLLASTAGALWMAGKVFRIGILRTGQPPKLLEMIRWVRR